MGLDRLMRLFMDRHDVTSGTAEDLAEAHQKDLAVQDRFGVRFLTYWFDPDRHTTFCLVEAPSQSRVREAHAEAHGMLPSQIVPVDAGAVGMFLGPTADPAETGMVTSAFRVIMFTDMAGSTDLTARLGDDGMIAVLRRHDAIVRAALDAHSGSEVKHTGDGIMASFTLVSDALSCAIDIQQAISARNKSVANDPLLHIRVGIAAGEPVTQNGDLFGAAVQLAARLCGAAEPDQILVAENASGLAVGKQFRFTLPAEMNLKGFPEPVEAVALTWEG